MGKRIIILILLSCASLVTAQELSNIPASFLNIGFGARALGMGGAYLALSDDVHSIVWNPAGLSSMERWQFTFSYTRQFGLIPYYFLASGGPLKSNYAHGEAFIVSGDEMMQQMRLIGGLAKYFETVVPGLRAGITLDLRHASFGRQKNSEAGHITGEAFGFSITSGVQYEVTEHIMLALIVRDLFNEMYWNSTGKGMYFEGNPMTLSGGIALKNLKGFNFDLDFDKALHRDTVNRIYFGVERPFSHFFVMRSGFAQSLGAMESNLQVALGTGMRNLWADHLFLDFTYLFHEIQNSFRMSVVFQR